MKFDVIGQGGGGVVCATFEAMNKSAAKGMFRQAHPGYEITQCLAPGESIKREMLWPEKKKKAFHTRPLRTGR